ncbi:MAG TPA: FmdB family zinc ribbon protein [Nitrospira sp.]|nr:FmdB family zinc ribbon protein [Nitrospira sp.]
MPIYEYQCDGCSYQFEVKQSIKDAPLTTCERCGKSLRRLISSPGIMFKGSGWYVTDYSNKLKPPSEGEKPATGEKKETPANSPSPASTTAAPAGNSATPASTSSTSSPASTPPTTNTPKS